VNQEKYQRLQEEMEGIGTEMEILAIRFQIILIIEMNIVFLCLII
jgi:hypothetical protein